MVYYIENDITLKYLNIDHVKFQLKEKEKTVNQLLLEQQRLAIHKHKASV